VVVRSAQGAFLQDVDGHRYVDYVLSWGPAILGHAYPAVVQAVQQAATQGLSFGCPSPYENELALLVKTLMPSMEMMRFVSSGTEAVMSALRLARAFTGRQKLLKFEGCYHGHTDALLVKAGSGVASLGLPDSAGVAPSTVANTLTLPFNDLAAAEALFAQEGEQLAAVLIEPVAGNMGCVPPAAGYLQGLRRLCTQYGALLVFDEVMTGFRVHAGGAQALYGITPDITTLGKILGGGLPVGAYGGRADVMQMVAPLGPMYQAGTLSGNPLGMAAGLATLQALQAPTTYETLTANTQRLTQGLAALCATHGVPHTLTQVGGMFSLFFGEGPITNFAQVAATDKAFFNRYFWAMLQRGVYLAPSAFEACFTSLCHTAEVVDYTLEAAEASLKTALEAA
jgi:glutamate-1-semialdehyde 2,1-aminomutase